jgi:uncharacterized membrane protein
VWRPREALLPRVRALASGSRVGLVAMSICWGCVDGRPAAVVVGVVLDVVMASAVAVVCGVWVTVGWSVSTLVILVVDGVVRSWSATSWQPGSLPSILPPMATSEGGIVMMMMLITVCHDFRMRNWLFICGFVCTCSRPARRCLPAQLIGMRFCALRKD